MESVLPQRDRGSAASGTRCTSLSDQYSIVYLQNLKWNKQRCIEEARTFEIMDACNQCSPVLHQSIYWPFTFIPSWAVSRQSANGRRLWSTVRAEPYYCQRSVWNPRYVSKLGVHDHIRGRGELRL